MHRVAVPLGPDEERPARVHGVREGRGRDALAVVVEGERAAGADVRDVVEAAVAEAPVPLSLSVV